MADEKYNVAEPSTDIPGAFVVREAPDKAVLFVGIDARERAEAYAVKRELDEALGEATRVLRRVWQYVDQPLTVTARMWSIEPHAQAYAAGLSLFQTAGWKMACQRWPIDYSERPL